MYWVDYSGQDVTGFDFIGTEDVQYRLTDGIDIGGTVTEIQRRCGKLADIKLFRIESEVQDEDR